MAEEEPQTLEPEQEVSPDVTLAALYKSARPPVELVSGVSLSAIINSALLPADAKAMLSESWIPVPVEAEEGAAPAASFDPSAAEFNEMQKRLSKSAPLLKFNELTITIKELETDLEREKDEKVREEKTAALEQARALMSETEAQLAELKASFQEDPLALVPWMRVLFSLADAGLTTFDVTGPFFPHANLKSLFSSNNSSSFFDGTERVLGVFKRRYEKERGPGKVQLLARLQPNVFQDGYSAQAYVDAVIEKLRANVLGAESTDPLDLVQLSWWDVKEQDVLPTLKALQRLTEDKLEVNEETGEVTITEPKKVRAIGLVDFPWRAVVSAVQAGVPVVSLSVPFSVADRRFDKEVVVAKEYGIKVFARDGVMGGLIGEKFLGAPAPSTTGPVDPDLDEVAYALDLANNCGGWVKVQQMLREVKAVADKHGVKMQTVALRWQIDQGTFPMASTRWGSQEWSQFGYHFWTGATPGIDWQVFQVESFLDVEDIKRLNALGL